MAKVTGLCVFLENFNVTMAQVIVPGVDISEHLSVVGSEAAGTTQIKFMMNGVVCLGSRDATNMAIANVVGPENIFIFD